MWRYVERVCDDDREKWLNEKLDGVRDSRLAGAALKADAARPLFRDLWPRLRKPGPLGGRFDGPSACGELGDAISASGLEPPAYIAHFLTVNGANPKSGLAYELTLAVHTLWFGLTEDLVSPAQLRCMEHVSRRILQAQRAIRRSPRSPDFEGLEAYMAHVGDWTGTSQTPAFDKHMAEAQKNEAFIQKQLRLCREEAAHERTTPGGGGGGGGGNGKNGKTRTATRKRTRARTLRGSPRTTSRCTVFAGASLRSRARTCFFFGKVCLCFSADFRRVHQFCIFRLRALRRHGPQLQRSQAG